MNGRRIDRNLIRSGQQQFSNIVDCAHTPTYSQRHEDLFRRSCDHVVDRIAIFVRRRDIEEGQLVGARLIVDTGLLHGVARIAKVDEIHTFHDTASVHI